MSENKHSEQESNIALVEEFCKSFFNAKRESSKITPSEEAFFKKHLDLFLKNHKKQNVYKLYSRVKGFCLEYCQKVITNGDHPFDFMESDFKSLYCENVLSVVKGKIFNLHCASNSIFKDKRDKELEKYDFDSIPIIIDNCLDCICAYAQEFDIISIYVNQFASPKEDIEAAKETLNSSTRDIKKAKRNIESLTKDVEKAKTDLQISLTETKASFEVEIAQQEKKSTESSITILGIFVAVVTVLFGGISFANSGLDAINGYSIKLFMLIGVIAIIIFDSILSLFYFLSKITDKKIVSKNQCWNHCPSRNCKGCNNHDRCKCGVLQRIPNWFFRNIKKPICRAAQKSKFAFWVNVILINALLFLYTLYILTHNRILGDSNISVLNSIISLIIPTLIIGFVFFVSQPCNKKNSCFKSKN